MLTHKHHIIPVHMGGTDEQTNLIELSVPDHAEAHRLLYEQHGHWQDYLAWQGLSGRMNKEELIRAKISNTHKGKKLSPEHIEILREKGRKLTGENNPMFGKKQSEKNKEAVRKAQTGRVVSIETKVKMSKASTGRKHTEETKELNRQWHLGKTYGQETRDKISAARTGTKQPESQKIKVAAALSKTWCVTSPEGVEQTINNLREFCRKYNLEQGNLSRGSYKGWKCRKL